MTFEKRFVPHTPDGKPRWELAAETEQVAWARLQEYYIDGDLITRGYQVKLLEMPHGAIS